MRGRAARQLEKPAGNVGEAKLAVGFPKPIGGAFGDVEQALLAGSQLSFRPLPVVNFLLQRASALTHPLVDFTGGQGGLVAPLLGNILGNADDPMRPAAVVEQPLALAAQPNLRRAGLGKGLGLGKAKLALQFLAFALQVTPQRLAHVGAVIGVHQVEHILAAALLDDVARAGGKIERLDRKQGVPVQIPIPEANIGGFGQQAQMFLLLAEFFLGFAQLRFQCGQTRVGV